MANKLKVAMVTSYPEQEGVLNGGVQSAAYHLANELSVSHPVEVIIVARGGKKGKVEKRGSITIHWLGGAGIIPDFIYYWTIERYRIHALLKAIEPDVVHFQAILGWLINYRKPCLATIHGLGEKDVLFSHRPFPKVRSWVIGKIENYGRKSSKNNIIINPYVLKAIGSSLKGNAVNIPNPVPDKYFKVDRKPIGRRILYVGRISKLKNIDGLIKVFSLVCKELPDSELRLCGAFESEEFQMYCSRLVGQLNLDNNVQFMGLADSEVVLKELSGASVLVLLSHLEMSPMVIEEAMAAGVPVVASNISGIPYMIKHGENGFLVDRSAHKATAEYICELLLDNELQLNISLAAKKQALEKFHVKPIAKQTASQYLSVVNSQYKKEGIFSRLKN